MPVANGGFKLNAGASVNVSIPDGWIGSWSPRTGCEFNAAGVGECEVGDCGGFLACDNDSGIMPANYTTVRRNTHYCLLPGWLPSLTWALTLAHAAQAEFSLNAWGGMDCYDVVLTYYTVAMLLQPSSPACVAGGCKSDLNAHCDTSPVNGRMLSGAGIQVRRCSRCGHSLCQRQKLLNSGSPQRL